ncbi:hypothetical protein [Sphingomonas sp.]|uniref:tetratricopeptide repeat protein n=1 Tax=Sphingomonas sp. TaxID=28214 RepID=UPI002ED7DC50
MSLLAGGLVGAALAFMATQSIQAGRSAPALAAALWPLNADAFAHRAAYQLQGKITAENLAKAQNDALWALRLEPGNVVAARAMATVALNNGDEARARRWLVNSERKSRRDLPTQLILIEFAVQHGDVKGALVHYDRALRSNRQSAAILLPVLIPALDDPAIRAEVIRLLAAKPDWRANFLLQLIGTSRSADTIYDIVRTAGLRPSDPLELERLQGAIQRLVALGSYDQARKLVPTHDARLIRNPGFEATNDYPPFDWQIVADGDLAGVIEPGETASRGNVLHVEAANDRKGAVARQFLTLGAGHYQLKFVSGGNGRADGNPEIVLSCDGTKREILRAVVAAGEAARRNALRFEVPSDCRAQWLAIEGRSSLAEGGGRPWLDEFELVRL